MARVLPGIAVALMTALSGGEARSQVHLSGETLPLSLAMEAVSEAIRVCEAGGYAVSVAVVDTSGIVLVQAKDDHATIHTRDSSFRKAYTAATFGPNFGFDATSAFAQIVAKIPSGPALSTLPNILPVAGGIVIKAGDEIIAAIGVGGAPGGDKDEVCARAGADKIAGRVGRR